MLITLLILVEEMRKIVLLLSCVLIIVVMNGCSAKKDVSSDSIVGDDAIIQQIEEVESVGYALFDCFDGFADMDSTSKYKVVKNAEKLTASMNSELDDIISKCKEDEKYVNIVFQVRMIQNLIPQPVSSDDQSLNNAAVLYQLFFQQLSSSFTLMSNDLNAISENRPIQNYIEYFDEMEKIPVPNTIIAGIDFDSKVEESNTVKYTYLTGRDDTDAQLNYNLYLVAIGMDSGLSLKFDGAAAYVYEGSKLVSAVMAGSDSELGNFFIVSFPQ